MILIGHDGHPEVEGTLGQIDGEVHLVADVADVAALPIAARHAGRLRHPDHAVVDDTEEVIEAIKARFADVIGPGTRDICYATQNRQTAVRDLAKVCDVVLVVGRGEQLQLQPPARDRRGMRRARLPHRRCRRADHRHGRRRAAVGLTAGASAPERLVEEVMAALRALGATSVAALPGIAEDVSFRLPSRLQPRSNNRRAGHGASRPGQPPRMPDRPAASRRRAP